MVLPRRNVVTAAVIGVALVLASGVAFAQFDPIDNQDYPPDPFGGGGSGDPNGWTRPCGQLSTYCMVGGVWVEFTCTQCEWYYYGVPVGPPDPCDLTCP